MIKVTKDILSFADAVKIAGISEKSVLVVRHSYRESLINGNHDPGLTAAGAEGGCALQSQPLPHLSSIFRQTLRPTSPTSQTFPNPPSIPAR